MSLSRTVALVTGGVSGLGAAAAQRLLRDGARVCVVDLGSNLSERFWQSSYGDDDETIKSDHHQTSSSQVSFVEADVTNPNQISHALDEIERRFGEPLNATVNCAGIATARKTLSKKGVHPLDEFAKVLSVNTIGSFNVASLAAERMSRRDPDVAGGLRGCIIHVASIAAMEGQIGQVAYAASKGGIVSMTLPMARDLASLGIRVMTIAPGLFSTPLLDGLPEDVQKELGSSVPCPNRLGKPQEFGQLVVSILENPMLNGSVIRLDGALRMPP